jgi:hypothetical protein
MPMIVVIAMVIVFLHNSPPICVQRQWLWLPIYAKKRALAQHAQLRAVEEVRLIGGCGDVVIIVTIRRPLVWQGHKVVSLVLRILLAGHVE